MANNYTQFSFQLTTPEGKEEEARKFNVYLTDKLDEMEESGDDAMWEKYSGVEIDVEDDGLWIHADESGNVEAAINITNVTNTTPTVFYKSLLERTKRDYALEEEQ